MWRQVAWRAGDCGGSVRQHSRAQRQHLPLNSSRQQKRQQVEAGAAVGGAKVAAGGSCRCLAGFRHRLTLLPTVARAAVREKGGGAAAGSAESLSPPPHTSKLPPPFSQLNNRCIREREEEVMGSWRRAR
ncbi:unnamed protein product [Closterium sp. NIES-54]